MTEKELYIDINQFEKQHSIGRGTFGKVYKAKNKETGQICAAKITKSKIQGNISEDKNSLLLYREVKLMSSLNHPSILKFIGYSPINFNKSSHPTIITEYASNGSLRDIIELENLSRSPKEWDDTRKLINIYGIAAGLLYLHANDIIHRDMKPENVLMDEYLFPKISDFGLSKSIKSISESMANQSTNHFKGTPIYMAPEILNDEEYSKPVDVYAYSIIVYEIVTGKVPFSNLNYNQLFYKVSRGERPELTNDIPDHFKNLISSCWSENPEQRPTFDEIVTELKNNKSFITDSIDENEYFDYIDFIDNYKSSYNVNNEFHFEDLINQKGRSTTISKVTISKHKKKVVEENKSIHRSKEKILEEVNESTQAKDKSVDEDDKQINKSKEKDVGGDDGKVQSQKIEKSISDEIISLSSNKSAPTNSSKSIFSLTRKNYNNPSKVTYPIDEFNELDQPCKDLVIQAETDPINQYIVGKSLIQGEKNFPQNVEIGVKYLEASISGKCIDSLVYYTRLLIKGDIIPRDFDRAKKYLKQGFKTKDSRFYHLNGILKREENKMTDAKKSFEKSAKMGNKESMYKLGKMLIKGEGCKKNEKEANKYFLLSKKNGYLKAEKFLNPEKFASLKKEKSIEDQISDADNNISLNKDTSDKCQINKNKSKKIQEIDNSSLVQINAPKDEKKLSSTYLKDYSQIPKLSIPNTMKTIDEGAFEGFSNLTHIIIPFSVTEIERKAFKGCTSLEEIIIPSSIKYIEPDVFCDCISLSKVSLPSSIKTIYGHAFNSCKSLKQITIPSSVESLVFGAFIHCSSLTQVLFEEPSSLKNIGDSVFWNCESLTDISIPPSVINIGKNAFFNCSSLKKIIIPNSLNTIKENTFKNCSSLEEVSFPPSIVSIRKDAFKGCSLLEEIVLPYYITSFVESAFDDVTNIIPSNPSSTQTEIVIPSSETMIKESSFSGFAHLKQISIPDSIVSIEKFAFIGCSSLTQIIIPSSVKSIKDFAFAMCSSLEEISIPSSIFKIGNYAFKCCSSLREVSIPTTVRSIGRSVFSKCSSLIKISLPPSLKTIEKCLFKDCSSLEHITLPSSLKNIEKSAFKGCKSLKEISLPQTLEELGSSALMGCKSLKEVIVPPKITNIEPEVFCECTSLENVSLPSTINTIYGHAFGHCTSLKQITIPSSVTCLVWCAFLNCTALTEITIPPSVTEIGNNVFLDCTSLKKIIIPDSISTESIGIDDNVEVIKYAATK